MSLPPALGPYSPLDPLSVVPLSGVVWVADAAADCSAIGPGSIWESQKEKVSKITATKRTLRAQEAQ